MATRRMTSSYGTAPLLKPHDGGFPLPPPPDGSVPVRLALGQQPRPQGQSPQAPMQDTTGQSDEQMLQLLKMLGSRQDQM